MGNEIKKMLHQFDITAVIRRIRAGAYRCLKRPSGTMHRILHPIALLEEITLSGSPPPRWVTFFEFVQRVKTI